MTPWRLLAAAFLVAAATTAVACGSDDKLDENGIVNDCEPESNAPSRVAGDTFTTAGGVEVEVLQSPMADDPAQADDTITVDYSGAVLGEEPFGDTRTTGMPFTFEITTEGAICGWVEGVVGMSTGEVRKLTIPPELAYGALGFGDVVPPDATMVFEIERIVPPENATPAPATR
jgi:FKBP-type peptidyl-prolyl cis-trans isomerase FkpA